MADCWDDGEGDDDDDGHDDDGDDGAYDDDDGDDGAYDDDEDGDNGDVSAHLIVYLLNGLAARNAYASKEKVRNNTKLSRLTVSC